jgi:hypothetical protein
MTDATLQPDHGEHLLQLARVYLTDVLQVPDELAALREITARLWLELEFARHDLTQLRTRVEALEQRATAN